MRKISTLLLLALVSVSMRAQTVVDIIVNSPVHNTLETAVIEANLAGTLSGPGPFTVFAPTDAAFEAIPADQLNALLADPSGELTQILLYHVVGGAVFAGDLSNGQVITTLQGSTAVISLTGGAFINDAQITVTDLEAENGVVHVIDAVLLPPPAIGNSIYDIIANSEVHNTLQVAVEAAGLQETLTTGGPFTVFAPTDDAFAMLDEGVIASLLEDPSGLLTEILLYHVVDGVALSTDLSDGVMVPTLNGQSVLVTINGDGVFINDALVVLADVEADNGVVHVIDVVLMPGGDLPTILEIVANSEVHNTLEAAVLAAGLDTELSAPGALTVFAPTDDAFAVLGTDLINELLADPTGDLTSILLYHVVGAVALSTDLSDGQMIGTLNGANVMVEIVDGTVFINGAQVILADIMASNGVVHVIDAVLLPPAETNTIVDIVVNSEVHNTLEAAVIQAGLVETLSGPGPFTVFAPTDAAFEALPADVLAAVLADNDLLTEILFYHTVSGAALSTDLFDGQEIVTLQGQTVTVSIVDGNVFINNAQVVLADIIASNGVVHVIDAVLVPEAPAETTVWDIISESTVHNTLEAAAVAAGIDADLSNPASSWTVFAPTDDAFSALGQDVIDALLADPQGDLLNILLYHAVTSVALSTDLQDGQTITTANGEDVTVTIVDGNVFINDAQVIIADLEADNGVVHVIDAVLLPGGGEEPFTVWDVIVNSADHTILETAVGAANLDGALSDPDATLTVFAPTDAAFANLPAGTIATLLANPAGLLTTILTYHVVGSVALSTDLSDGQTINTLQGEAVTVSFVDGNVFINEAQVIVADIITDNGVVHVIDAVLLPPSNVNESAVANLSVYPNPTNNILNVTYTGTDRVMFEVVSITGSRVMEGMLNEWNNQLNVAALQNGIYTIRLINGNDVKVSTFMKQ